MRTLLLLGFCCGLWGCAAVPAYIPTGNPVTDVLVTAAVYEAGSLAARSILSGGDSAPLSFNMMPCHSRPVKIGETEFAYVWE